MKIKISKFIFLAILLNFSCKSIYPAKKQTLNLYISEFKTLYFKTLLKKGFNNSTEYKKAVRLDRSGFTEPLITDESFSIIEKYTTEDNNWMVKDSIKSFGKRAEGSKGKRVFYFALEKYNSRWLDSIAKAEAKKYWQKNK